MVDCSRANSPSFAEISHDPRYLRRHF
jgi:hypothetical protein